jgi:hypothetical protein
MIRPLPFFLFFLSFLAFLISVNININSINSYNIFNIRQGLFKIYIIRGDDCFNDSFNLK